MKNHLIIGAGIWVQWEKNLIKVMGMKNRKSEKQKCWWAMTWGGLKGSWMLQQYWAVKSSSSVVESGLAWHFRIESLGDFGDTLRVLRSRWWSHHHLLPLKGLGHLAAETKYLHAWLTVALLTSADVGTTIDAIRYAKSTLKPQKLQFGVMNNDFASSAAGNS